MSVFEPGTFLRDAAGDVWQVAGPAEFIFIAYGDGTPSVVPRGTVPRSWVERTVGLLEAVRPTWTPVGDDWVCGVNDPTCTLDAACALCCDAEFGEI